MKLPLPGLLMLGAAALLLPFRASAQTPPVAPPPPPTGFDSKAPTPPGLPDRLDIPPFTRLDVQPFRKSPRPPDAPGSPRPLWAPDPVSATFTRAQDDLHAVYRWEGDRSSEAFILRGITFLAPTLAYPNAVSVSSSPPALYLGRQVAGGSPGTFPETYWYTPGCYVGTASLDGRPVLVFAPAATASGTAYPSKGALCLDAKTLLPVRLEDATFVFTFAYSPASDARIDPQGPFLKAAQTRFGQWPPASPSP